jgi:hypothetical protein
MKAEAERLVREGRMPPLAKVLRAIEESRRKYRRAIWTQESRRADGKTP